MPFLLGIKYTRLYSSFAQDRLLQLRFIKTQTINWKELFITVCNGIYDSRRELTGTPTFVYESADLQCNRLSRGTVCGDR